MVQEAEDLAMGEDRGIVQPALTSLQTLFHMEHNRIADRLSEELGKTSLQGTDELIYQEAKKLVTAEVGHSPPALPPW